MNVSSQLVKIVKLIDDIETQIDILNELLGE